MEIQKIFSEIDTDERLYSVLMSEEELSLYSEMIETLYSEEEESQKSSGLKKAGKAALIGGSAAALAGGIGENVIAHKVAKNAASKYGVERVGAGLKQQFYGIGKKLAREVGDIATKALKQNKGFKAAKRADIIGSGVALAGAGMLAANKIKNKKNKDNK